MAKSPAQGAPSGGALSSILGHRRLLPLLRQAVARGRVPQSLLFAGPEGVGKRTVAVALAQALNCPTRIAAGGDDACGRCPVCLRIARGQFTDVVRLDRGDHASIKIEPLRERVLDVVGYRPFEGARRVFIIDNADDLTEQAQDALLKTLEEPPPSATLMLVTAFPDSLRPTIQSRCRRLRFGPLVEEDVVRVLVERAGIDAAKAKTLATVSAGSVSRALAAAGDDLEEDRGAALAVITAAHAGRLDGRLRAATDLAQFDAKTRRAREALGARLSVVGSLLRDLALLSTRSAVPLANADFQAQLERCVAGFDPDRLEQGFAAITEAERALDGNASPKIVADWIAVRL
jgi:DNA polymerase-3 subunit delta'